MIWILSILLPIVIVFIISLNICSNIFVKSKCKLNQKNTVALTFDDGPHPKYTSELLDVLKILDVKATFFVIGENAERNPELIKRIVSEGHTLGHHSYSHSKNWGWLSTEKVKEEIEKSIVLLEKIGGQKSIYFRPPFGVTNPNIAKAIRFLGLVSVGWTLRSYDTTYTPDMVIRKIGKRIKSGDIILMHDHLSSTPKVVETIVKESQKNGLIFVNLEVSNMI